MCWFQTSFVSVLSHSQHVGNPLVLSDPSVCCRSQAAEHTRPWCPCCSLNTFFSPRPPLISTDANPTKHHVMHLVRIASQSCSLPPYGTASARCASCYYTLLAGMSLRCPHSTRVFVHASVRRLATSHADPVSGRCAGLALVHFLLDGVVGHVRCLKSRPRLQSRRE